MILVFDFTDAVVMAALADWQDVRGLQICLDGCWPYLAILILWEIMGALLFAACFVCCSKLYRRSRYRLGRIGL